LNSDAAWFRFYGKTPRTLDYPDISMYDIIKRTKESYPTYTAYDFMGKAVTYEAFLEEIDTCAKALTAMGIRTGDAVTVCLPNTPQAIVMFYAINKIGAVASMVHPLSAENEILFDYELKTGRATSQNAIALLGLLGYPEEIIQKSKDTAAHFLEKGEWKSVTE